MNVDTSAVDGRRSPFNFINHGVAIIYLMPVVLPYTTIYIEWLGVGRAEGYVVERTRRKKDGHMRVLNAHVSRTHSFGARSQIASVHKCVQTQRNAAGLYKQFDPHCRTCTQRRIFGRFSVLTVSACLHTALSLRRAIVHSWLRYLFRIRSALPGFSESR